MVKGRIRLTLDNREIEMGAGEVLLVSPGRFHSFTGLGPALLLELSMPCQVEDNTFADPDIPIGKGRTRKSSSTRTGVSE